jgi:hypothetical protein
MKVAVRRLSFWKGIWFMATWRLGTATRRPSLPFFAPVRGDDNNNCIFITREYDSFGLKENGTIPFYRRFFPVFF